MQASLFSRPQLRARLVDQLLGFAALDTRDVVLVLEQHAQRIEGGKAKELIDEARAQLRAAE
jgi:hypothetical protein